MIHKSFPNSSACRDTENMTKKILKLKLTILSICLPLCYSYAYAMRVYASGNTTRALNTLMNTTSYHFYSVLAEPKLQEYFKDFISAWKMQQ